MTKTNESGNILLSLLQIMFIGFKLSGIITWSWWYVMLPTLIPVVVALVVVFVMLIKLRNKPKNWLKVAEGLNKK